MTTLRQRSALGFALLLLTQSHAIALRIPSSQHMAEAHLVRAAEALPDPSPSTSAASLSQGIDTASLYSANQRLAIQIVACVMGGISMFGSILCFYWFLRMKKMFRHELIMLLFFANIVRSMWYFIFPLVAFSRNDIKTHSSFCQASGFFTQYGLETADFSILFIAIHTAMQVFKPRPRHLGGQGGLHPYRYLVYAAVGIIPLVLAAAAFANGRYAYKYQGPVCNLPLRPFWYRLGLSWIPRYAIMATILALYVAIYVHAGFAMAMPKLRRASEGPTPPGLIDRLISATKKKERQNRSSMPLQARKVSDGTTLHEDMSTRKSSYMSGSQLSPIDVREPREPSFITSALSESDPASTTSTGQSTTALRPNVINRIPSNILENPIETTEMRQRRDSIRRHLRLLFIYPVIYFAVWTLPFILNILNYNSYYVQHPPFPLALLAYLAVSSMGIIDCVVFSLREQPWRSIQRSDGTFMGSFSFWKKVEPRQSVVTTPDVSQLDYGSPPQSPTFRNSRIFNNIHTDFGTPQRKASGIGNWDFATASSTLTGGVPVQTQHEHGEQESMDPEQQRQLQAKRASAERAWFDKL